MFLIPHAWNIGRIWFRLIHFDKTYTLLFNLRAVRCLPRINFLGILPRLVAFLAWAFFAFLFIGREFLLLFFTRDVGDLSPCFVATCGVSICGDMRLPARMRYSLIDFRMYVSRLYQIPNVFLILRPFVAGWRFRAVVWYRGRCSCYDWAGFLFALRRI